MASTQPLERPRTQRVDDPATRAFSISMLISGIRCTLTYVIFPWILPALGVVGGVGPVVGVLIGLVAIASNIASIRRFHRSGHKWRWQITLINVAVIGLLLILLVEDLTDLL